MGRSLKEQVALVTDYFQIRGVRFVRLTDSIHTTIAQGKSLMTIEWKQERIKPRCHSKSGNYKNTLAAIVKPSTGRPTFQAL
jgi:uncharacterized protein YxjI